MAGDRWHESGDPPLVKHYNTEPITPRKATQPKKTERGKRYDDDDGRPRKSMRAAIVELVKADPAKRPQEIKRELELVGYDVGIDTAIAIRNETLGRRTDYYKRAPSSTN